MDTCPKCHRKLLAHCSARCNWCGELIDDVAYQEEATKKREEFFTSDRLEQASEIATMHSITTMDKITSSAQTPDVTTFLTREVFSRHHPEQPRDSDSGPDTESSEAPADPSE